MTLQTVIANLDDKAAMIATGEPREFTPFGREYLVHHPGSVRHCTTQSGDDGTSTYRNTDLTQKLDFWKLRESSDDDSDGEEELYVSGDTAVWSVSNGSGIRTVLRTFCVESKIQDALWCSFLMDDYKTRLLADSKTSHQDRVSCVVILEADTGVLHSFSRAGDDYTTAIPFVVSRAWPIRQGLLLERSIPPGVDASPQQSTALSVLFSLLHPLDEVAPVVTSIPGHGCIPKRECIRSSANVQVVFSCEEPSFLLMYHHDQGTHSAWEVRRTTSEEDYFANAKTQTRNDSTLLTLSSLASPTQSPISAVASSLGSPAGSWSGANPRLHSSTLCHMATLSRSQSPSQTDSPQFRLASLNNTAASTAATSGLLDVSAQENGICAPIQPLLPDICLDFLWREPQPSSEMAFKTFLVKDMVGQHFLCYHLPCLKVIKLVSYNHCRGQLVFGKMHSIPALDAQPVPSLGQLLALDLNHGLSLYTGPSKVCKVHVPSFLFAPRLEPMLDHGPRRSSLDALSRTGSVTLPELHLSPVQPIGPFQSLHMSEEDSSRFPFISLRDAVKSRVTIETSSKVHYRLGLPSLSKSNLVQTCLGALRSVLPKDLAMHLLAKWYMSRNAPGPIDLTASAELHSFLVFVLGAVGCPAGGLHTERGRGDCDSVPPAAVKKSKSSEKGSNEDWQYLLACGGGSLREATKGMPKPGPQMTNSSSGSHGTSITPLSPHIHVVLHALHLVYEDSKLNVLDWPLLPRFAEFLFRLSAFLGFGAYQDLYRRDFPEQLCGLPSDSSACRESGILTVVPQLSKLPPSIFGWIEDRLFNRSSNFGHFPFIPGVLKSLRAVVLLYTALTCPFNQDICSAEVLNNISLVQVEETSRFSFPGARNIGEKLVFLLVELGVTPRVLERWPSGIVASIQDTIVQCQDQPPLEWTAAAYHLIGREDLASLSSQMPVKNKLWTAIPVSQETCKSGCKEKDNGFDQLDQEMLKLRFSKDQRVVEVCKMLQSSRPVSVAIQQRPEVSDHEFVEEQERHLYSLCIRTMALPVGRGMLTLRTCRPVLTDPLTVPKLCLTGRVPVRNTAVEMSHIEVPPNMNVWPLFHNGVAAGLRVCPNATDVDSTWIVYNRPRGAASDGTLEHAGFLLGLGLNGHLARLSTLAVHDYVLKNHELTSVGLLLGLAASRRGSMDLQATKLMSIHVEALLPPTSTELDVHPLVRVASVMGLGLLYAESGHRRMAEVLLGEIGRPPGPEMDHCVDRESYALTSGLALGLVMLGKGSSAVGSPDLHMADLLYHYMVGGQARSAAAQLERFRSPSYQIREGNTVNVDVTSPAATLALGLMFFNSGNLAVAGWMAAPDTQYLLDMVRPDFLLLRTLGAGLVLWSKVHPSKAWVEGHLPEVVAAHAFRGNCSTDVDHETMSQAYCNILAGACLCLGLRFAGSANGEAFKTLRHYAHHFLDMQKHPTAEQAGRNTLETCLLVSVLSLALVMAGTGDLEVMRLCRHLRLRSGQASSHVLYGSHLSTHMALGLLFLGGGGLTLGTSPLAVAALVCALFPRFPIHSSDNRYHLQAFRHLYVLAAEPRLLLPVDIASGNAVYVQLTVTFCETDCYGPCEYAITAPCHLPELHLLSKVSLQDPRYWPISFERGKNWRLLQALLQCPRGLLRVKQKAGCLPYAVDPTGCKTAFEQSAIKDLLRGWSSQAHVSASFSENTVISKFTECFLQLRASGEAELCLQHSFGQILLECTLRDKVDALSTLFHLFQLSHNNFSSSTLPLWQAKVILAYYNQREHQPQQVHALIHADFVHALEARVEEAVEESLSKEELRNNMSSYFKGGLVPAHVFPFLVLHNLPILADLPCENVCLPELCLRLSGVSLHATIVLASLL